MKRVAVVYPCFPHYRGAVIRELSRSEQFAYTFYSDTRDKQFDLKPHEFEEGDPHVRTKTAFLKKKFLWQKGMIRLALDPRYDAVIYHGDPQYITTWLSVMLAKRTGKQVHFWTIGWLRDERGVKDRIRVRFLRLADTLMLYGGYAKKLAVDRNFPADRLHVINNSLDTTRQAAIRGAVSEQFLKDLRVQLFDNPHPILICTTRLVKKRKLEEVLGAMKILQDRGHHLNLLLVGDGPERESLEALSKDLALSVHFFGECYDDAVLGPLLMLAHACVAPGMVGLTAMHSLAFGTPVITHNDFDRQSPEWEALEEGRTGGFFKFGDVEHLAEVILQWTSTSSKSPCIVQECIATVEARYSPSFQRTAIENALMGGPPLL